MPDAVVPPEASAAPLSQTQRVVDTFVAPSKTFTDILRSSSWWLPWIIAVVVTLGLGFAIQQKIGWDHAYQNMMRQSPKQMERIQGLPADQQARAMTMGANFTKIAFWATPLVALIIALIAAAVLLATVNFGFGGRAKFSQMFAVWMYGTLPWAVQGLLGIITVYFGVDPDSFNLKNFVGTNIGYYLPTDWSQALITLGTALDITTIWALILLTIGCSIVGNISKGKAAGAVFGWWILITLVKVGIAAAFS
ncbi:MAG: YIP1 family protein [Acidobacteriaceae bacterium]